jgi:hypothetical protein
MSNGKTCPLPDLDNEEPWERNLSLFITFVILIAGIYNIITAKEIFFGILSLIALAILWLPGYFTGRRLCAFPSEIQIILLFVVFFELVLGDMLSFYSYVPLYDKFMHAMLPSILGMIGMMIIYTSYAMGYLKTSLPLMFLLIIFVVMGCGAMLEMSEFFYDQYLYPIMGGHLPTGLTQGSMFESPLVDTMHDLYLDAFGAIFGAGIGVWFIRRSKKSGKNHLINELRRIVLRNNK